MKAMTPAVAGCRPLFDPKRLRACLGQWVHGRKDKAYWAVAVGGSPSLRGPSSALDRGVGEHSNQPPVGVDHADFVPFDWVLHDLDVHCSAAGSMRSSHSPHTRWSSFLPQA